jgi:hypothetical protein
MVRALQRDPALRFASAAEFAQRLAPYRPSAHGTYATHIAGTTPPVQIAPASRPPDPPLAQVTPAVTLPAIGPVPTGGTIPAGAGPAAPRRKLWLLAGGLAAALVLGVGGALLVHRLSRSDADGEAGGAASRPAAEAATGPATSGSRDGTPGLDGERALFVGLQAAYECALPELLARSPTAAEVREDWQAQCARHGVTEQQWLTMAERYRHDPSVLDEVTRALCRCAGRQPDPAVASLPVVERALRFQEDMACRALAQQQDGFGSAAMVQFQRRDLEARCVFGLSSIALSEASKDPEYRKQLMPRSTAAVERCRAAPSEAPAAEHPGSAPEAERDRYVRIATRINCDAVVARAVDPAADSTERIKRTLAAEGLDFAGWATLTVRWTDDPTARQEIERNTLTCASGIGSAPP